MGKKYIYVSILHLEVQKLKCLLEKLPLRKDLKPLTNLRLEIRQILLHKKSNLEYTEPKY